MKISTKGRYALRLMLDLAMHDDGSYIPIKDIAKRQSISDKYLDYAGKVLEDLKEAGIRAEIDSRAEKIGYKIREAQMKKIPYMLVVGAKEEEEGKVSVRSRFAGDEGQCGLEEFIEQIKEEVAAKNLRETVQDK